MRHCRNSSNISSYIRRFTSHSTKLVYHSLCLIQNRYIRETTSKPPHNPPTNSQPRKHWTKDGQCLQAGAVDDLHVDGELTAVVVDDEDADAATARGEGIAQAGVQVGLLSDGQGLLDVAGLGHGYDGAALDVEDTVLLEDGAKHGLNDNAGAGVRDERGLFVQLLGEDIDTEVAVLAGGGRGGDADHLARAALQHEVVANADVVAGDRHSVGEVGLGGVAGARPGRAGTTDVDIDINVDVLMVVVRVDNLVSHLVQAVAEGVVVAVLVVVTHLGLLFGARVTSRSKLNGDVGVFLGNTLRAVLSVLRLGSRSGNVYVGLVGGTVTLAVFALGNVNGAGVRLVAAGVNLNVRLSVLRARR
jgi:hypothetical protein